MDKKSFLQAGHTPTLIAAFLYFDLAFMVWVILGPLAVGIAADLGLSHAEKGLIVATPVLAGAILRMVMGVVVDRLSPKTAAIIGQKRFCLWPQKKPCSRLLGLGKLPKISALARAPCSGGRPGPTWVYSAI